MAVDRRQLLLGVAAGAVVIVLAWSQWPATPVASAPAAQAAPAARGRGVVAGLAPAAPVNLEALTSVSREGPGDGARNPFRFQPRAAAAPPRPVSAPVPVPVNEAAPQPLPPPGPPPAPPIPLKLIGVLERASGVKWAVLSDGKSGPMYGKDGDIIDGRYTIVKIGTESIEMTHADGRGRQVIRLTGQ